MLRILPCKPLLPAHFPAWSPAPARLELPADDTLHLWLASLDQPAPCVESLFSLLSSDEQLRANRLHTAQLQQRYIVGRGLLRILLAHYLGKLPQQIQLKYGPHGKPALADHLLTFNLAHSGDLLLIGCTAQADLGVDLEQIRPLPALLSIAHEVFATSEIADLLALPDPERLPAFYTGWTRKEACIKAQGDGLQTALDEFAVTMLPDQPARIRQINGRTDHRWSLLDVPVSAEYRAAAAFSAALRHTDYWLLA